MKTIGRCASEFLLLRIQVFVSLFLMNLISLPSELVEERFRRSDIDDAAVLVAAGIGTRHSDMLHRAGLSNSFNQRRDLLPVFFNNTPVDLVLFGFHVDGGILDEFLIVLRCVVKRMDGG